MAEFHKTGTDSPRLTRRERSSLDLVARGRTASEGAARLGISTSTFAKHLAGARAKLGVSRTAEAVAICVARGEIGRAIHDDPDPQITGAIDDPAVVRAVEDLLAGLEGCLCFREAWSVFCRHTARIGAASVHFGLIAEPRGLLTSGARIVATSLPDELNRLYDAAGGMHSDPFARWMTGGGGWLALRTDRVPGKVMAEFSPEMADFATALPDHGYRCILGSSLMDPATGASLALPFGFSASGARDAARHQAHYRLLQQAMSAAFWHVVQGRALLRELVPLSARMREALRDAASGLAAAESAARMGVSRRAVEKLLADARHVFAAPTTAAAIYRATVYRALA